MLKEEDAEYTLYGNKIRYIQMQGESWDKWTYDGVDMDDSVTDIWEFTHWLKKHLIKSKDSKKENHTKYQVLYLLYFLLELPERTFHIIENELDVPEIGLIDPIDHYFYLQSAWRILESKKDIESYIGDAKEDCQELIDQGVKFSPINQKFQEFILNISDIDSQFTDSAFFPFYKKFNADILLKNISSVLTTQKKSYKISSDNIDWQALFQVLLLSLVEQTAVEKAFTIDKKILKSIK